MPRTGFGIQVGLAASLVVLSLYLRRRRKHKLPLPPGPKKLPLIGNLLDMPKRTDWITYHKWSQELGSDIIHLDVAGTSIIVLDSEEAITDLLEKRSSLYSGRPRTPMASELMGWSFHFAFMDYGDKWRQHRRQMHQQFRPDLVPRFQPHELKATHRLLRRLLDDSSDFQGKLRLMAGEIILTIAYGLQIQEHDDPYVAISQEAVESLNAAVVPGAFFVDFLPVLKHVPEWVPGAGFKRKARAWRALALATVNTPFEGAVRAIDSGDFTPSFVSYSWENLDASGDLEEEKEVIKGTAAAMYSAGLDTMVSIGASCILGFLSNPEALRKARQEIDRVVGTERLPNFGDRDSLPYIIAVTKEALRWKDVGPLAIPHFIDVEDEYKGYRIPAGSIVLPNAWAILHNEAAYPDPFTFNPDRFMKDGKLNEDIKDPASAAFGFGRRICPGRYMGFSAVWITIASLVAAFDIGKAVDADGNVIEPSYEYTTTGLIHAPLPFECSIKPRSPQAEILIRETLDAEYF